MRRLILLTTLFFSSFFGFAQPPDTIGISVAVNECFGYMNSGQQNKALNLASTWLERVENSGTKEEAILNRIIGDSYNFMSNFPASVEHLENAIRIFESLGEPMRIQYLKSKLGLAITLSSSDLDNLKAREMMEEILEEYYAKEANLPPAIMTTALNVLSTSYLDNGEFPKAIEGYERALQSLENSNPKNHAEIGLMIMNLGVAWGKYGYSSKAHLLFKKAEREIKKFPGSLSWLNSFLYNNLAASYRDFGNFSTQIIYDKKALEESKFLNERGTYITIPILNQLSEAYQHLGEFEKAKEYSEEALTVFENVKPGGHFEIMFTVQELGGIYYELGDFEKAEIYHKKAVEHASKIEFLNSPEPAIATNLLGIFYLNTGKLQEAEIHFQKAIELLPDSISTREKELLNFKINMAKCLLKKGETDAGIAALTNNAERLQSYLKNRKKEDLGTNEIKLFSNLSKAWFSAFELTDNLDFLKKSAQAGTTIFALADSLSTSIQQPESFIGLSSFLNKNYAAQINTNFLLFDKTNEISYLQNAFKVMESSDQNRLNAELRKSEASRDAGVPNELIFKEKALQNQVEKLNSLEQNDSTNTQALQAQLLYSTFSDSLRQAFPLYKKLQSKTSFAAISDFQKSLNSSEIHIRYFIEEDHVFILKIGKNQTQFFKKKLGSDFQNSIADFTKATKESGSKNGALNKEKICRIGHELYQTLLQPCEPLSEKITIIPHRILGFLPFEILLDVPANAELAFGELPFLIKKHSISYQYSSSAAQSLKDLNIKAKGFLAIAPDFQSNEIIAGNLRSGRAPLRKLLFNREEAETISKLFDNQKLLLGEAATSQNFKAIAGNFDLLHFATHAVVDVQNSLRSFIAFSNIDSTETEPDLSLPDIYNLDLNANMVVTSVCDGGIGELKKGEGIISLARGFIQAGAKNVVTSLWSVNDKSGSEIMVSFYENLKKGMEKDDALRQAKLTYLDNNPGEASSPFYWAAFVSYGDQAPVDFGGRNYFWWILGGIGLLSLGFYFKSRLS